jgi:SRSO17 transposase
MSLLDYPEAVALLADADVSAADVQACQGRLESFLGRYLPLFYRHEQRELARVVIRGKISNLQRKTSEPIAYQAGRQRKPVQHFVGAGCWDDDAVQREVREHVAQEIGAADGVLIVDPSGFAKKGTASCGVDRQWCGRLGKLDNCQVGVFLAYATSQGSALVDRQLYLPKDLAFSPGHRRRTHVPAEVSFQEKWRIALDLIDRSRTELPCTWVVGDDEFGRASLFREGLRGRRLRYVLDVPCNTLIRVIGAPLSPGRRRPEWQRVDEWAKAQPSSRWRRVRIQAGAKGPLVVRALEARVQTRDEEGRAGKVERILVIRTVDREPQVWYAVSNAPEEVSLDDLVKVHAQRHHIEELLELGKGEVGLDHYEVRSWVGWHHHMTLSLLALWFLQLERRRMGKKNPGDDRAAIASTAGAPAATSAPHPGGHRRGDQPRATPQRRSPHLSLA